MKAAELMASAASWSFHIMRYESTAAAARRFPTSTATTAARGFAPAATTIAGRFASTAATAVRRSAATAATTIVGWFASTAAVVRRFTAAMIGWIAAARGPAAVVRRISTVMRRWRLVRWRIAMGVVVSSRTVKSIAAPSVVVAPVRPRPHSQEYAVIKISWPVVTAIGTRIGRIAIVSVGANRWRPSDGDNNLRVGLRGYGDSHKQYCCTCECFDSAHF